MAETTPPRTRGLRYAVGAAVMLVVGLLLNAAKPIWFAPPLLAYTPLVYTALALAWLPLLYGALTHLMRRSKLLILLLILVFACGQWFCWASVAPRKHIIELTGDISSFSERRCEYTSLAPGETTYAWSCELDLPIIPMSGS